MSDAHRDEIAKLESLYQEHPEGRIFTHLAEAYRKAGELDRAQTVLSEGIERHPDYSSAHVVLGRVLMDQDRTDEAEREFRRVLELDPQNLIAIRSLGDLARARGDDDQALELYHRLLEQEPGESEVREIVEEISSGVSDVSGISGPAAAEEPDRPFAGGDPLAAGARSPAREPQGQDTGEVGQADLAEYADGPVYAGYGDDAEVRTETIAQVYARQGLYDRAAEVYRELVRARPEDDGLRERLAEMEQLAAQAERTEEVDAVSDVRPDEAQPLPGIEWTGASEEIAEGEVDEFTLDGFEATELDTSGVEAEALPGLEPDTPGALPGSADLSEELGVTDVPEPPEEAPWGGDLAVEMEEPEAEPVPEVEPEAEPALEPEGTEAPDWLAEALATEAAADTEESQDAGETEAEVASAESVWSGAEWQGETEAETTPHAWTEDEDESVDASPPIRDYFSGLLGWSDGGADGPSAGSESAGGGSVGAQDTGETPAHESAHEAAQESAQVGTDVAGEDVGKPAGGEPPQEDDDLDMFRSWLESLKQ